MARNVSGVYSLPLPDVVTGTVIEAPWANTTMNDLKAEMTDSLSRSGKGGMTAPLKLTDGSSVAPAIAFSLEPSTGWYRAGAGDLKLVVSGAVRFSVNAAGLTWYDATPAQLIFADSTQISLARPVNISNGGAPASTLFAIATNKLTVSDTGLLTIADVLKAAAGFKSDLAAADTGRDFKFNTANTRTAGLLFDVQNNTVSKMSLGPTGILTVVDVLKPLAGLKSDLAGASGSTDFLLNTTNTRTAGLLLDVQNNGTSRLNVSPTGTTVAGALACGTVSATGVTYGSVTAGTNWTLGGTAYLAKSAGFVALRYYGTAAAGATTAIGTLPAGFRPIQNITAMGMGIFSSGTVFDGVQVNINSDGTLVATRYDNGTNLVAWTPNAADSIDFTVTFPVV